jgi:transposase
MTNETLIILCLDLYEQGIPKSRIAQRLGKHRETIHLWIKSINRVGANGLEPLTSVLSPKGKPCEVIDSTLIA